MRVRLFAALSFGAMLWTHGASAAVIDSTIITHLAHYRIDEGSFGVYYPPAGFLALDGSGEEPAAEPAQPAQLFALRGNFDVEFARYEWEYTFSTEEGSLAVAVMTQDWLTLTHPVLEGLTGHPAFRLPGYPMRALGSEFSGDIGPCSLPSGPDTYCSGVVLGPLASVSGRLNGQRLTLNGWLPTGAGFNEGYGYNLTATAVPLPGALWFLSSGVLGLLVRPRFALSFVLWQRSRA